MVAIVDSFGEQLLVNADSFGEQLLVNADSFGEQLVVNADSFGEPLVAISGSFVEHSCSDSQVKLLVVNSEDVNLKSLG